MRSRGTRSRNRSRLCAPHIERRAIPRRSSPRTDGCASRATPDCMKKPTCNALEVLPLLKRHEVQVLLRAVIAKQTSRNFPESPRRQSSGSQAKRRSGAERMSCAVSRSSITSTCSEPRLPRPADSSQLENPCSDGTVLWSNEETDDVPSPRAPDRSSLCHVRRRISTIGDIRLRFVH